MTDDRYFSSHSTPKIIQATQHYKLARVTFKTTHERHPPSAWFKYFDSDPEVQEEAYREIQTLIYLKDFADSLYVVKYLYHIISQKKCYLFIEECDRVLSREIKLRAERRDPWPESELLQYLKDLASTVFKLHAMKVVHRDITQESIFVKRNKLLLGHFDDSKQVARGVTNQRETIRGTVGQISPEINAAIMRNGRSAYKNSFQGDIWGLGRTFLDMASLGNHTELIEMYRLPQADFTAYIVQVLGSNYSPAFVNLICKMLTLDGDRRPSAAELLELLEDFSAPRCGTCNRSVEATWPCGHFACTVCMKKLLRSAVNNGVFDSSLKCPCGSAVPDIYVQSFDQETAQLLDLLLNREAECPFICAAKKPRLKIEQGKAKPYKVNCACGKSYCSYCLAKGGHGGFLGRNRNCPTFTYE